jgi:hypothetical protein
MTQSSPSFTHDPRSRESPVIGTRKFSVKSSDRPTTMNTNAIPNASEPTRCACSIPARGSTAAAASPYTATPRAMSKPPTSAVAASSSTGRDRRRRRPSRRVRS